MQSTQEGNSWNGDLSILYPVIKDLWANTTPLIDLYFIASGRKVSFDHFLLVQSEV